MWLLLDMKAIWLLVWSTRSRITNGTNSMWVETIGSLLWYGNVSGSGVFQIDAKPFQETADLQAWFKGPWCYSRFLDQSPDLWQDERWQPTRKRHSVRIFNVEFGHLYPIFYRNPQEVLSPKTFVRRCEMMGCPFWQQRKQNRQVSQLLVGHRPSWRGVLATFWAWRRNVVMLSW